MSLAVFSLALAPAAASAEPITPPAREAVTRATEHYERGKELYRAGAYREALAELAAAHALDPTAKQLVFNLAMVHEKLGELDAAIGFLREFLKLEIDGTERERAESTLRRLEGARRAPPPPVAEDASLAPPPKGAVIVPPANAEHAAIDAPTVFSGVVALTALGVGTFFGLRALSDRPVNFVVGVDGTFADLQRRNVKAHREAIIADISLGAGAVAAVLTAYFFFSRPSSSSAPPPHVSFSPLRGGGAIVFTGSL